jgi:hypothetical protein
MEYLMYVRRERWCLSRTCSANWDVEKPLSVAELVEDKGVQAYQP